MDLQRGTISDKQCLPDLSATFSQSLENRPLMLVTHFFKTRRELKFFFSTNASSQHLHENWSLAGLA